MSSLELGKQKIGALALPWMFSQGPKGQAHKNPFDITRQPKAARDMLLGITALPQQKMQPNLAEAEPHVLVWPCEELKMLKIRLYQICIASAIAHVVPAAPIIG